MLIKRSAQHPDVFILRPQTFSDERGRFFEGHRSKELMDELGHHVDLVQSNISYSIPWTLRGLHFQTRNPQAKLMRCVFGRIQHVGVDLRENSPYYGVCVHRILDDITCEAVWLPAGFAAGFLVPGGAQVAIIAYECSTYYTPEFDGAVNWADPDLNIPWILPQGRKPILSNKDRAAPLLKDIQPIKV